MKPLEHRFLQCIFCDDIREEVGGKKTIVGWHAGETIAVPKDGAIVLPSLCLVGLLSVPPNPKFSSLSIDLTQDDDALQHVMVPAEALEKMQDDESSNTLYGRQIQLAIKMTNLSIDRTCVLRLRVTIDEEELFSNGLRFSKD